MCIYIQTNPKAAATKTSKNFLFFALPFCLDLAKLVLSAAFVYGCCEIGCKFIICPPFHCQLESHSGPGTERINWACSWRKNRTSEAAHRVSARLPQPDAWSAATCRAAYTRPLNCSRPSPSPLPIAGPCPRPSRLPTPDSRLPVPSSHSHFHSRSST